MREVGRLREMAFRGAGGGTGREVDIDEEDLAGDGYYQLIVWDPAAEEIVGGYRFIICTSERPRRHRKSLAGCAAWRRRATCPASVRRAW